MNFYPKIIQEKCAKINIKKIYLYNNKLNY